MDFASSTRAAEDKVEKGIVAKSMTLHRYGIE